MTIFRLQNTRKIINLLDQLFQVYLFLYDQTNFDKHRVAANITESHIITKLILMFKLSVWNIW